MGREVHSDLQSTSTTGTAVLLRMNLYKIYSNRSVLQDGTLTQFGDNYSNKIDGYDARKMSIQGENISLFRNDTDLVIERRKTIQSADTIFFRMWGMQQSSYKMEIVPSNLNNGLTAYLEDDYLHINRPLDISDTTEITFSVTGDPASYAQFRFKIIFSAFKKFTAIPFTFVSLHAINQDNEVLINWQTANQINLQNYQIERSYDQKNYQPIATVNAASSSSNVYQWTDKNPLEMNYYRIRTEVNGNIDYSEAVKVVNLKEVAGISVYPNPVIGKMIHLQLNNQETGNYRVIVYNSFGEIVLKDEFNCSTRNATVTLSVDKIISKGIYYLQIMKPFGKKQLIHMVF